MQARITLPILLTSAALFLASCSSVDMPKGSSKGYSGARLVQIRPGTSPTDAKERKVHGMIQNAISEQFTSHGLAYGTPQADLVVSYLVVYQETGMTTYFDNYFGAASGEEISDVAHERGVIEGKRPDFYRSAGIVIDVTDARTNELVYRGLSKGDVVQGASDSVRAQRIANAVAQALDPFFH